MKPKYKNKRNQMNPIKTTRDYMDPKIEPNETKQGKTTCDAPWDHSGVRPGYIQSFTLTN